MSSGPRVLIYSHDSFGLGHLRRCRAIAHGLVSAYDSMSVLILSGSPIIGSFDFRTRVDFVRVPGVIKLRNGEYTSLKLHLDIEHTLKIRSSIIQHTAEVFAPDIFLVDKEPLGLRGEVRRTLRMLRRRGTRLVLGLRDVMDEPAQLAPEWERKQVLPALTDHYDDIWVYGLPQVCNPLAGIDLPAAVENKITYTGYLRRHVPQSVPPSDLGELGDEPYILVTTGGGGDGEDLIDWVLSAYEHDATLPYRAIVVLGPFMHADSRQNFMERVARLDRVEALTFDAHLEALMANAVGVVAMGGYNTFCEILSMNKRAIIMPRKVPRLEQYIRASRAHALGLVRMLDKDADPSPAAMADALHRLPEQQRPSDVMLPGLLDGLDTVNRLVGAELHARGALGEVGGGRGSQRIVANNS